MKYMLGQREKLGGFLPQRKNDAPKLEIPSLDIFKAQLAGTGDREVSTTMAFVRMLTALTRDKKSVRILCRLFQMRHVLLVWKACSVK